MTSPEPVAYQWDRDALKKLFDAALNEPPDPPAMVTAVNFWCAVDDARTALDQLLAAGELASECGDDLPADFTDRLFTIRDTLADEFRACGWEML